MSQLTYVDQVAGFAGLIYDLGPNDVVTRVSEEASAEIPFGVAVALGTLDNQALVPAASTAKVQGVVTHAHIYAPTIDIGDTGLKPKVAFGMMRRGRLWVRPETAVVALDRAHVRHTAGAGGTQKGAWRNSEVSGETLDVTAEAVFVTSAGAGELAVLEVDFTNS